MARRRRSNTTTYNPSNYYQRGNFISAIDPASMLVRPLRPVLSEIEFTASLPDDLRTWVPEPRLRRPQTFSGTIPVTTHSRKATPFGYTQHFAAPQSVVMCVRRKQRREVIHALNLTGKGAKARSRRRTSWSDVKC